MLSLASILLFEGTRMWPDVVAAEGLAGAGKEGFLGSVKAFLSETVGFGADVAAAVALPRFQTLATSDLAEERNPNRGLGLG